MLSRFAIYLVSFYRRFVSPLKPPSCRFYPTCSQYAIESVETHGFIRGSIYTGWRILRCNPFVKGGYDPVPPPKHPALPSCRCGQIPRPTTKGQEAGGNNWNQTV